MTHLHGTRMQVPHLRSYFSRCTDQIVYRWEVMDGESGGPMVDWLYLLSMLLGAENSRNFSRTFEKIEEPSR